MLDLRKTIDKLSFPKLKASVDATPTDAAWDMQSVPLHSQIIAAYFFAKDKELDGLFYPSTKNPGSTVYAIFKRRGQDLIDDFKLL